MPLRVVLHTTCPENSLPGENIQQTELGKNDSPLRKKIADMVGCEERSFSEVAVCFGKEGI